jgi:hypothetical protein
MHAAPSLEITHTPAYGSLDNLGGRVVDADPAAHRVAVFIYVPSAGWWSKPYCAPALTLIQPDGSWITDITTGGVDELATQITALLMPATYDEPCVMGLPALPANVLAQAIASDTVVRVDPAVRRIQFSGYDWWAKDSPGLVGPGPNLFSDSTNNVWVAADGRLHLRITNRSNQWQCAEVVTDRTFGYGSYRFEVESVVDDLDSSVVLGLFTWSDDPAYTHREIDVECGRWADRNDTNNSQFVVQPWNSPGHLARYRVPGTATNSTHLFIWETNRIQFQCQRGSYVPTPAPANILGSYTFTNAAAVPQTGDENVRINLWLINGTPPTDTNEVEVIIKSFEFVPLGAALPAQLRGPRFAGPHLFLFEIQGQADRRYRVEHTANLAQWNLLTTVLATNPSMAFTAFLDADQALGQFYRTITLP